MQLKEFNILLDIKKHNKTDYFEVVQGDLNSNILNIALVDGLNPYNLAGTNVEIVFSKPDGTTVQQTDIIIINATQGRIQCTLKTNTIASPGKVIAEVRVLEGEILLTSARFDFFVRKALITDDTIESTNEFPILNQLITTTEGLIQQVEQIEKQVPEYIVEAMGDLEDLETEDKSSLVNAINEVNNKSVDLTPIEERIGDLEQDLDSHKAENVNQGNPHGIDAKANKVQENWRTVTLLNGWGEVYPVGIRKNEFGNIEFKGVIDGGAINNDTTLFSLPEDCRVTSNRRIVTVGYDDSAVNIQYAILNVTTSGDVRLFRVSSSNLQYLSLDGVVLFR